MFFKQPKVVFSTEPELYGVIPEPVPARTNIPEWFKRLKNFTVPDEGGFPGRTIKRCPPFLDALVSGWLIPTPCEIEIVVQKDQTYVEWNTRFSRAPIEPHANSQIEGHPGLPRPPLKFNNYWHMKTPPGWSTLFVPPLNRENEWFTPLSGIVETDKYFEYVNFPSILNKPDGTYIIPAGTPIVQAIPFKRGMDKKATIRAMNKKELAELDLTRRRHMSTPSRYRDSLWERK